MSSEHNIFLRSYKWNWMVLFSKNTNQVDLHISVYQYYLINSNCKNAVVLTLLVQTLQRCDKQYLLPPNFFSSNQKLLDVPLCDTGQWITIDTIPTTYLQQMTCYCYCCLCLFCFLNEAFRFPNHKTCFSFALESVQNLHFRIHLCPFSPVSTQNCTAGLGACPVGILEQN